MEAMVLEDIKKTLFPKSLSLGCAPKLKQRCPASFKSRVMTVFRFFCGEWNHQEVRQPLSWFWALPQPTSLSVRISSDKSPPSLTFWLTPQQDYVPTSTFQHPSLLPILPHSVTLHLSGLPCSNLHPDDRGQCNPTVLGREPWLWHWSKYVNDSLWNSLAPGRTGSWRNFP